MRKADKPLFFLGLLLIVGGLLFSKIFEHDEKPKHVLSPTPVVALSPTATTSATPTIGKVLGNKANQQVTVTKVVDGDTIQVVVGDKKETIRLIGVDTPETVDPRKKVQCFGKEASNFTKQLLANKTVFLETDPTQGDRDKYQRLLAYVFLQDGTNFNTLLLQEGYAHEYTYDLPYKYQAEFKEAELQAQTNKKGFWADNACP